MSPPYVILTHRAVRGNLRADPATEDEAASTVTEDLRLGLLTVACPRCGITAGVLPGSATWHAHCGGVRMVPADPEAAARLLKRARDRRWYRNRAARASQNVWKTGGEIGEEDGPAGAPRPEGAP